MLNILPILWQIERVAYPGLPSSRFHPLAQKYLGGRGGGVLAFEVRGGKAAAEALLKVRVAPLSYRCMRGKLALVAKYFALHATSMANR